MSLFEDLAVDVIVNDWQSKVEKQSQYGIEYARQACCRYPGMKHGMADLVVRQINMRTHTVSRTIVYEMKSSVSDLNSGSGINFTGDWNYIVYPEDGAGFVKYSGTMNRDILAEWLDHRGYDYVGIIRITRDERMEIERQAHKKDAIRLH